MDKWECRGCHQDGGMTQRNGQVGVSWALPGWRDDTNEWTSGVSWMSPGWWGDIKEWTSGSVVAVTRMT